MKQTSRTNYNNFWACDFETTTPQSNYYKKTGDVCVCLAGAVHSKTKQKVVATNFIKLLDGIIQARPEPRKHTLYFHNLGNFDGSYILAELEAIGYSFEPEAGDLFLDSFMNESGNIYTLAFKYQKRSFKVFDSLKSLPLSIGALGKVQGLEKLEMDYDSLEPLEHVEDYDPKIIEYMLRDCEIIIQPILDIQAVFKNPRMTAGSTAVQGLKDFMGENGEAFDWFTKCEYDIAIESLPFCNGGLTFYNHKYNNILIDGVYCYDANSFYPTQMSMEPMIVGSTRKEVDVDYITQPGEVGIVKILCTKAKIKNNAKDFYFLRNFANQNKRWAGRNLDYKDANAYVPEVNKCTFMWFFECELEALKKWYDIDYIVDTKWVYETSGYMKPYIDQLYEQRKLLKSQKDPREHVFKISLNSIFGKFMESPIKTEMLYLPTGKYKLGDKVRGLELVRRKDEEFDLSNNEAWVGVPLETQKIVRNPIIGAYITALARTRLMNIVYEHREYVVYGDTDSIFIRKRLEEFENRPNELGEWKNEFPEYPNGVSMYVYGCKRYLCFNSLQRKNFENIEGVKVIKAAMCGVNKKSFLKMIEDEQIHTQEALDNLINKPLKKVKIAKNRAKGKIFLEEVDYCIKGEKK